LIATTLNAADRPLEAEGSGGYPYFTRNGRLMLLMCGPGGKAISTVPEFDPEVGITAGGKRMIGPVVRPTADGARLVVWVETVGGMGRVFLGRIHAGRLTGRRRLSAHADGDDRSPDLAASRDGTIWTVWVSHSGIRRRLTVAALSAGDLRIFTLNADDPHTPRIVVDLTGTPWVFWTSPEGGLDGIYASRLTGGRWTPPENLSGDSAVPHFHPSADLNPLGFPMVAWSGFDGEDYEIRTRSWDGARWGQTERVTRNRRASDGQPALLLYRGEQPLIAWTRNRGGRREIRISRRRDGVWEPGLCLAAMRESGGRPVWAAHGDELAVAWRDGERIKLRRLSIRQLETDRAALTEADRVIGSLHLDRSTYIGVGDSITFGAMNGPYKNVGYLPRLSQLLEGLYSGPRVINRGVPGEATWEAVSRIESVVTADLGLYLLLMEGTNDVSTTSYSLATTAFNLKQMVLKCREFGVFPLISTIPPRARSRWTTTAKERTLELNQLIIDLAEDTVVPLVDNYTAFDQHSAGHEALISDDNLHPNLTGYQVMAETWYEGVRRLPFSPVPLEALKYRAQNTAVVTWRDSPRLGPATQLIAYRIYRKEPGSGEFKLRGSVPASQSSFSDGSVDPDRDYFYAVSALRSDQVEGPISETVLTEMGEPDPPVGVAVETILNKAFLYREYINRITWNANPLNDDRFDITNYRIYRKPIGQPDDQYILVSEVPAPGGEYLDRGFSEETAARNLVYGISAVDEDGNESSIEEGQT